MAGCEGQASTPSAAAPITGYAVIRALGFETRAEPHSLWDYLKFTAEMLRASCREAFQTERELQWLAQHSRSWA
jgi:hypothetical protein